MKEDFLKLQNDFEKLIKDKEKGIVKNYANSFKKLRKKLQTIYDKYEKDGVISKDELRKYNRLKELDKYTAGIVLGLYLDNKKLIRETLKEVIDKAEKGSFTIINNKVSISPIKRKFDTAELINKEIAGKVWTERLKHHGDNFVYDVHSIVRQGLERGDTYTTMAKNLKEKFGKDIKNATTIVRTESARVQEYTKFETMKEINKEVPLTKTWRTMKDEAVRNSHQAMEGVTVKYDEEFILPSGATCMFPRSTGYPEEDINCRCYIKYNPLNSDEDLKEVGYNITIDNEQFGKKVGKHAEDFNLNPKKKKDRDYIRYKIYDIVNNGEEILVKNWRGYGEVIAKIKGQDVVLLTKERRFITIMKGGINNDRIKNARKR